MPDTRTSPRRLAVVIYRVKPDLLKYRIRDIDNGTVYDDDFDTREEAETTLKAM